MSKYNVSTAVAVTWNKSLFIIYAGASITKCGTIIHGTAKTKKQVV